jgi:hypothetical protein
MEMDDRIRLMELSLTRMLQTNAVADTKVATLVGMNTTMLALLAALVTSQVITSVWLLGLAVLSALGLLLGLLFLSLSSFPRTSRPARSIVFFGAVSAVDAETYANRVRTVNDEEYLADLIDQCYRTASIAKQKFRWIQRAQMAWYSSIIPWLLTVYLVYHK